MWQGMDKDSNNGDVVKELNTDSVASEDPASSDTCRDAPASEGNASSETFVTIQSQEEKKEVVANEEAAISIDRLSAITTLVKQVSLEKSENFKGFANRNAQNIQIFHCYFYSICNF